MTKPKDTSARVARLLLVVPVLATLFVTTVDGSQQAAAGSAATWVLTDRSRANRHDVVWASAKLAAVCHDHGFGRSAWPMLSVLSSTYRANLAIGTRLACILDAPATASCGDLAECAGQAASLVDAPFGKCNGSTLLRTQTRLAGKGSPEAIACGAFGQSCFEGEAGVTCGTGPCDPGQTYSCDGNTLVACVQGISQRIPCGAGLTCGRTKGSKVIDCIAAGTDCTADACDGTTFKQCVKDSFGKGSTRNVDCAAYGLVCQTSTAGSAGILGACVQGPGGCDPAAAPTCKGGKITICVAGREESVACGDVGLSGSCVSSGGGVGCK